MFLCGCFGPSRPKIPEDYLKPQGLYPLDRVDLKKLKRLIRSGYLAPCYPGKDSVNGEEAEECPICFLHYPVLNSSRCCGKRVCTECFLQVQTSAAPNHLSICPFCKTPGYTAKFNGARSAEEKEQERLEEQKVIEARIREREEELRRDRERDEQRAAQAQQQAQDAAAPGAAAATPARGVQAAAAASASGTPATAAVPAQPHGAATANNNQSVGQGAAGRAGAAPPVGGAAAAQQGNQRAAHAAGPTPAAVPASRTAEGPHLPVHHAGGMHRRGRSGGNRRYRLTDYVPAGVADIAMGLEDINDLMLEQALYESLAQDAAQDAEDDMPPQLRSGLAESQQRQQQQRVAPAAQRAASGAGPAAAPTSNRGSSPAVLADPSRVGPAAAASGPAAVAAAVPSTPAPASVELSSVALALQRLNATDAGPSPRPQPPEALLAALGGAGDIDDDDDDPFARQDDDELVSIRRRGAALQHEGREGSASPGGVQVSIPSTSNGMADAAAAAPHIALAPAAPPAAASWAGAAVTARNAAVPSVPGVSSVRDDGEVAAGAEAARRSSGGASTSRDTAPHSAVSLTESMLFDNTARSSVAAAASLAGGSAASPLWHKDNNPLYDMSSCNSSMTVVAGARSSTEAPASPPLAGQAHSSAHSHSRGPGQQSSSSDAASSRSGATGSALAPLAEGSRAESDSSSSNTLPAAAAIGESVAPGAVRSRVPPTLELPSPAGPAAASAGGKPMMQLFSPSLATPSSALGLPPLCVRAAQAQVAEAATAVGDVAAEMLPAAPCLKEEGRLSVSGRVAAAPAPSSGGMPKPGSLAGFVGSPQQEQEQPPPDVVSGGYEPNGMASGCAAPSSALPEGSGTTLVPLATIAEQMLRHGSSAQQQQLSHHLGGPSIMLGMVLMATPTSSALLTPLPHGPAAALAAANSSLGRGGPALVENPDGSWSVMVPAHDSGAGGVCGISDSNTTALAAALRRAGVRNSLNLTPDEVQLVLEQHAALTAGYADYDLPAVAELGAAAAPLTDMARAAGTAPSCGGGAGDSEPGAAAAGPGSGADADGYTRYMAACGASDSQLVASCQVVDDRVKARILEGDRVGGGCDGGGRVGPEPAAPTC